MPNHANAYGVEVLIDRTAAKHRVSWIYDGIPGSANASGPWITQDHRTGSHYDVIRNSRGTVIALKLDLVRAVKHYALTHYDEGGWDVIVECWDDEQIVEHLRYAEVDDVTDPRLAIDAFRDAVAVWADQQADARNSAF